MDRCAIPFSPSGALHLCQHFVMDVETLLQCLGLMRHFGATDFAELNKPHPGLADYRLNLQQPFSPALFSPCNIQSFLYPSLYGLGSHYARLTCDPICKVCYTALVCHMQPSAPPSSLPIWALLQLCLCSPHTDPSGWERFS